MLEIVPVNVDNVVVLNAVSKCPPNCSTCADYTVGIHNWLLTNNFKYLIVDLQDEKEVCASFLEELLQLRKRLRFPFLFVGVMEKPRRVLEAYDYDKVFPVFISPEEAVRTLRQLFPEAANASLEKVTFGQAIQMTRVGSRMGGEGFDGDEEGENEEEEELGVDGAESDDEDDED